MKVGREGGRKGGWEGGGRKGRKSPPSASIMHRNIEMVIFFFKKNIVMV